MRALAVFHDHGCHVFDPLLKRGFRHVFVALQNSDYWIRVDAMSGVPEVQVLAAADYDLTGFYLATEGFTVLELETGSVPPLGPFVLANCVGCVKVLLGIRAPFAITPYQLYRRLRKIKCSH